MFKHRKDEGPVDVVERPEELVRLVLLAAEGFGRSLYGGDPIDNLARELAADVFVDSVGFRCTTADRAREMFAKRDAEREEAERRRAEHRRQMAVSRPPVRRGKPIPPELVGSHGEPLADALTVLRSGELDAAADARVHERRTAEHEAYTNGVSHYRPIRDREFEEA
jgi:hypothetical protein